MCSLIMCALLCLPLVEAVVKVRRGGCPTRESSHTFLYTDRHREGQEMFKHRDNIAHSPFTTDPQGSGMTMKAVRFGQEQQQQQQHQMAGNKNGAPEAAGKKRPRDIRGIERFRQVIYGEKGLPRFHAMVARNPTLMYPPDGIDAERARIQKKREEDVLVTLQEKQQQQQQQSQESHPHPGEVDTALWAMFEERRAAEEEGEKNTAARTEGAVAGAKSSPQNATSGDATSPPFEGVVAAAHGDMSAEHLANYHHRQLDALMGLYYEFNHLTFMKLPMSDTLQLLQRCGKEAVAHCLEFEMQLRMRRETRLKELGAVAENEMQLKQRELEAQTKLLEMQMQVAEEVQVTLDDLDEEGAL